MRRIILLMCMMLLYITTASAQSHTVTRKPHNNSSTVIKPPITRAPSSGKKTSSSSSGKKTGVTTPPGKQTASGSSGKKAKTSATGCPDGNHPHAIDLGLPSGTKWACCNVGAGGPEDYGGYYAWGETMMKKMYIEKTYMYYQNGLYVNLGRNIAGTNYDVAHVKWGGSWVMPSIEQIKELLDNCTSFWTTINGVEGSKFIGMNGRAIFLPAADIRIDDDIEYLAHSAVGVVTEGSPEEYFFEGYYWSSTQFTLDSNCSYGLDVGSGIADLADERRYYGLCVRPVSR